VTLHQLIQAILDSGMDVDQICEYAKIKPKKLLEAFPRSMWDNREQFFEALGIRTTEEEQQHQGTEDEVEQEEEEGGSEEPAEEQVDEGTI
jgi:hypothetical protein